MSLINTQVQPFKTTAFVQRAGAAKGEFIDVTEADLKGKWSVVIFMPAAFTFNCPTEIEDAANNYAEFQKAGAEVYIVTTDTEFSHKVWHETSPAVGKAKFPLVADQRELRLADGRRGFVPDLVREVGVGGDDVDLGTGLLELGVMLGGVFDFGRAVEGEGGRHEDHHGPLALQVCVRNLDELAVVEGVGGEGLHLGIDQGHRGISLGG